MTVGWHPAGEVGEEVQSLGRGDGAQVDAVGGLLDAERRIDAQQLSGFQRTTVRAVLHEGMQPEGFDRVSLDGDEELFEALIEQLHLSGPDMTQ